MVYFIRFGFLCLLCLQSCTEESTVFIPSSVEETVYETENVVIVVIDGARFSDTWGHPQRKYITGMAKELAPQGTFFMNFRNEGVTRTISGHTAITTGNYQLMANDGSEFPQEPSIFQRYLQQTNQSPAKASIFTSKPKLDVLFDCRKVGWRGRYNPSYNCGVGNENRSDKETLEQTIKTLQERQPRLVLIQFSGPDIKGHQKNWSGYLQNLQITDSLVAQLWQFIQQDEYYKGKTALFITNDHGRHSEGHKKGYVDHGDKCEGCRHISLLALGPDFAQGEIITEAYELTDIAPTIAQLMGFHLITTEGRQISQLLNYAQ